MQARILAPLLAVVATQIAVADTLAIEAGGILSGTLIRISQGTVYFKADRAGEKRVPIDEVRSLTTASDMEVALADGKKLRGRFVLESGVTYLRARDGARTQVALKDIAAASPLPEEKPGKTVVVGSGLRIPEADTETEWLWEAGLHLRYGRRHYADAFTKLTLFHDAERYNLISRFMVERADERDFPRWFLADAEWRLNPADDVYPVWGIEIERDTDRALRLRGGLSAGAGAKLVSGRRDQLEITAGLGAENAEFNAESIWDERHGSAARFLHYADENPRLEKQQINLRLALHYEHGLFRNSALTENVLMYPSLTDFGRLRARSESAVLFPVTSRLRLKLNLLVDYESAPVFQDLDPWRTSVGASVLWDF
jgi:hypothetical protein